MAEFVFKQSSLTLFFWFLFFSLLSSFDCHSFSLSRPLTFILYFIFILFYSSFSSSSSSLSSSSSSYPFSSQYLLLFFSSAFFVFLNIDFFLDLSPPLFNFESPTFLVLSFLHIVWTKKMKKRKEESEREREREREKEREGEKEKKRENCFPCDLWLLKLKPFFFLWSKSKLSIKRH